MTSLSSARPPWPWVFLCSLASALSLGCTGELGGSPGGPATDAAVRATPDLAMADGGGEPAEDLGEEPIEDLGQEPIEDLGMSPSEEPAPAPTPRPVFVAQGHLGRTLRSCDGGRSWRDDVSIDATTRCQEDGFDCTHHEAAAKGIAYGAGSFFSTWGWGPPGGVDVSSDGLHFTRLLEGTRFGGVAFGDGVVVLAAGRPIRSLDGGASFSEPTPDRVVSQPRRVGWVPTAGGFFVLVGDNGVFVSRDGGASWQAPERIPADCGQRMASDGGIAGTEAVAVVAGGDGVVCASSDGERWEGAGPRAVASVGGGDGVVCASSDGERWEATEIAERMTSQLIVADDTFFLWRNDVVFTSNDGESWREEAVTPAGMGLGPTAYHPATGAFVGVRSGWRRWYEEQRFYRSDDGVLWEELPADASMRSHPIIHIAAGFAADGCGDTSS